VKKLSTACHIIRNVKTYVCLTITNNMSCFFHSAMSYRIILLWNSSHTWSDNKVRELATVCLPWQHWTTALVWFDDNISVFHSCVVVDLWQSLSGIYYCLCVFWCATARMSELELEQRTNFNFLLLVDVDVSESLWG